MKKVKIFKVLILMIFIVLVVVLPTVCVFMPYNEPYVVGDEIITTQVEGSETKFNLEIQIKNPTMVKVTSMGFSVAILKKGWEEVEIDENNIDEWRLQSFDTPLVFDKDIFLFASKKVNSVLDVEEIFLADALNSGEYEFVFIDGYFTYTKLSAFWWYFIGLTLFCVASLFFIKQKFYFQVGNNKVEVYAGPKSVALIVNGEVIENKSTRGVTNLVVDYKIGDDQIKLKVGRPGVMPNVQTTVNDKEPNFTKVKINSFLKLTDKKKGAF